MAERPHADVLNAAADKLDALVAKAVDDVPAPWRRDELHRGLVWDARGELVADIPNKADRYIAAMNPVVGHAMLVLLRREANRVGSHAITTRKVRENWYAYDCHTCGDGGSASEAGVAMWQAAHSRIQLAADEAILDLAGAILGDQP